ncbi:MAG: AtpZ/AtpI family protein [Erysipelotrichaceae bacterium]|nr:AtpZ/AtpI family protein [Erysipelotrichaceae bacterium]
MKDLVKALTLGSTICFCFVLPTYLGVLADRMFHTEPLWILTGIFVGLCGAFLTLKELVK